MCGRVCLCQPTELVKHVSGAFDHSSVSFKAADRVTTESLPLRAHRMPGPVDGINFSHFSLMAVL